MTQNPLCVWLGMIAMDLARYLLVAGAAFLVFWVWGRKRFEPYLIQGSFPKTKKLWHDARWSMSTAFIFSLFGLGVWYGGHAGILRQYRHIADHGFAYFGFTVLLLIVLQDTYFYWTHRAMHHPRLYRAFHRVHHVSTNPSPWTAYAFAPLEAITHAAFVPLVWLVVPMHELAVFAFLLFMIVRNVHGHLSMELYPTGFTRSRLLGFNTTTTHHNLHHRKFTSNYGLYFSFWDRAMGTLHPDYEREFERVAKTAALERALTEMRRPALRSRSIPLYPAHE